MAFQKMVSLALAALLATSLAGCAQHPNAGDQREAQAFAERAFESFRTRQFASLPRSSSYTDATVIQTEEIIANIPTAAPSSSTIVGVEFADPTLAIVRTRYVYPDQAIEVAVGMERHTKRDSWKLYGLSVTPGSTGESNDHAG